MKVSYLNKTDKVFTFYPLSLPVLYSLILSQRTLDRENIAKEKMITCSTYAPLIMTSGLKCLLQLPVSLQAAQSLAQWKGKPPTHDETAKRPRLGRTKAKPSDTNAEKAKLTMLKQVHSTLSATSNDCLEVFASSKHAEKC